MNTDSAAIDAQRVLAHKIVWKGEVHTLAVASLSADAMTVDIEPFTTETAATVFVSGTIYIKESPSGKLYFSR